MSLSPAERLARQLGMHSVYTSEAELEEALAAVGLSLVESDFPDGPSGCGCSGEGCHNPNHGRRADA